MDEVGDVELIIVGLPINEEDYEDNEVLDDVRSFVSTLREEFPDVEVQFLDERFSSAEADELIEDLKAKGRDGLGRDAYAAQIILQRFFDNAVG
jgi:putative Holliday junction resolvase